MYGILKFWVVDLLVACVDCWLFDYRFWFWAAGYCWFACFET